MTSVPSIPVFGLFGETDGFPDAVHVEDLAARAPENDWQISAHRHSNLVQLFLFEQGHIEAQVDSKTLYLQDQAFLFVPALHVHGFRFKPDTTGVVVSVPSSVAGRSSLTKLDLSSALNAPIHGRTAPDMATLAGLLTTAHRSVGAFRVQRSIGLAHALLGCVAEHARSQSETTQERVSAKLRRLDELIDTHVSQSWSASDYASALSMTTGHLSRLCRMSTGLGATAYIEKKTMEEACRLLAFTQLPVSEIAYRLGYADPSYFSKRFHKSFNLTPTTYRAQFVN